MQNSDIFISESELATRASKIKMLVLDVDGVLTDGKLYFDDQGKEMKAFSTLDGHGIKLLRKTGVEVAIITGRKSNLVALRANDLGIPFVSQGREDKFVALNEILENFNCKLSEIAYVGDDHPDLLVMTKIGLAISVNNAHSDVVENSHWQTKKNGGQGAVREVCDVIIRAQGNYDKMLSQYIN